MKPSIYIILLLFISCISNEKSNEISTSTEETKQLLEETKIEYSYDTSLIGKNFYDYDEIIHYSLIKEEYNSLKKNRKSSLKYKAQFDELDSFLLDRPKEINFLKFVESKFFIKRDVPKSKFIRIDSILIHKVPPEILDAAGCIKVFRDILVFKRNKTVVGAAKICFSCGGEVFLRTEQPTQFDVYTNIGSLEKVLENKK